MFFSLEFLNNLGNKIRYIWWRQKTTFLSQPYLNRNPTIQIFASTLFLSRAVRINSLSSFAFSFSFYPSWSITYYGGFIKIIVTEIVIIVVHVIILITIFIAIARACSCYMLTSLRCWMTCLLALDEAQDISLYLKPFKQLLDQIELVEFKYIAQHLPPLMHVVCLTWSHSRYYCRPGRVVVLLQEVCNLLIEKVSTLYLHGWLTRRGWPPSNVVLRQCRINP